jgi:hypothetical protein
VNEQLEDTQKQLEAEKDHLEAEKKQLEAEKKRLEGELRRFRERLAQYEPGVWFEGKRPSSESETPSSSYSLDAENKRRRTRGQRRKKSPGRRPTEVKFADATQKRDVYPEGIQHADCRLVRERAVWRLEDGKAVLIGYRIFAGPGGDEPRIPGVTPRCEYGIEILVVLAFLKYVIGISLDVSVHASSAAKFSSRQVVSVRAVAHFAQHVFCERTTRVLPRYGFGFSA